MIFYDQGEAGGASATSDAPAVVDTTAEASDAIATSPAIADQGTGAQIPDAPFFTHGTRTFKSPQELSEAWRRETLNHQDYSTKNRELAEQRKAFEAETAKHRGDMENWQKQGAQWSQLEQMLQSRPDVQNYLGKLLGEPPKASDVQQGTRAQLKALREEIMREVQPVIDSQKQAKAQQEFAATLNRVAADTATFPNGDYPHDEAAEIIEQLSNSPRMMDELAVIVGRDILSRRSAPGSQTGTPVAGRRVPAGTRRPPQSGSTSGRNDAPIEFDSLEDAHARARAQALAEYQLE